MFAAIEGFVFTGVLQRPALFGPYPIVDNLTAKLKSAREIKNRRRGIDTWNEYHSRMKRSFIVTLCLTVLAYAFTTSEEQEVTQPPEWVQTAILALSDALQQPVTYLQSGPQNVFYVETLPTSAAEAIMQILNTHRTEVVPGGAIVVLGLDPETAYLATSTNEAQKMTNSTMVGYYATMIDGQARFGSSQGLGELSNGCVSSSDANSSSLSCNYGGQSFGSRCSWRGDSLVCRSTNN